MPLSLIILCCNFTCHILLAHDLLSFPSLFWYPFSYFQEKSVILSGILYLGPSFVIISILNIVAISNGTTAAIPIGTIIVILIIYVFISIPLLAFGGIIGHRFSSEFEAPCATKRNTREIPPLAWFRKLPCQVFISGLLSFSAVVLELHHLYASMWGFKIFTLPSILFLTFIVLAILTAILSVGLTYIQLSVEDHQWWWRYLLCPIFMMHVCSYLNVVRFLQYNFRLFNFADRWSPGAQPPSICLDIAFTSMWDQIWMVSCSYASS